MVRERLVSIVSVVTVASSLTAQQCDPLWQVVIDPHEDAGLNLVMIGDIAGDDRVEFAFDRGSNIEFRDSLDGRVALVWNGGGEETARFSAIPDLDRNGKQDLALRTGGAGEVLDFLSSDDLSLIGRVTAPSGSFTLAPVQLIRDQTGDAVPEIVAASLSAFGGSGALFVFDSVAASLQAVIRPDFFTTRFGTSVKVLRSGGQPHRIAVSHAEGLAIYDAVSLRRLANFSSAAFGLAQLRTIQDCSGDGVDDLVVAFADGDRQLTAVISSETGAPISGVSHEWETRCAGGGDFDGDGAPDFAVAGRGTVSVFSGRTARPIYTFNPELAGDRDLAVDFSGDVNRDGLADLVIAIPHALDGTTRILCIPGRPAVDLNQDGEQDGADFLEFLSMFFASDARLDMDYDGTVNGGDFLIFLSRFFGAC